MLCYFYAFQLNIDQTTAVPSLVRVYVCLSGCLAAWFSALVCVCVGVRVCLSVQLFAKVCSLSCRGDMVYLGYCRKKKTPKIVLKLVNEKSIKT